MLLREIFAVFAGNELSAGILISGWLFFEGVGAWLCGKFINRIAGRLLEWWMGMGIISGATSLLSVIIVLFSPRLVGLLPGEVLSLPAVVIIIMLVEILPAGTHGALFTLGAEMFSRVDRRLGVSHAYVYEGLGTFLAGLVLYFILLSRMSGIGIILLFTGILFFTLAQIHPIKSRAWLLILVGSLLFLSALTVADDLNRSLVDAVWRGHKVLSVRESAYGKLITLDREGQRQILYDGAVVMSIPPIETPTYEQLIHLPMILQENPEKVLILGSGIDGMAKEVLKHPVKQVLTVQIDPVLLEEMKRAGGSTVAGLVSDPRVRPITADPRRFLSTTKDSFDVIIVSIPSPLNLNSSRLFTVEFFQQSLARLKANGMVVTYTPGSGDNLFFEARVIVGIRQATFDRVFPYRYTIGMDFPLIIGSKKPVLIIPETLTQRLREKDLNLSVLTPVYLQALLDPFRQLQFKNSITNTEKASQDLMPRELFFNLLREIRRAHFGLTQVRATLPEAVRKLWLVVLIIIVMAIIIGGLNYRGFARGFGIMSSGFAGAGISALAIMIYQTRFGSVYSGSALLLSGFMLGTVLGAVLSEAVGGRGRAYGMLFLAGEIGLLGVLGIMFLLLYWGTPLLFVLTLVLTGTILGWQFGIASAERSAGGKTAGMLSALDFTGGAWGGFLVAIVLVPVGGMVSTVLLIGGVKLLSILSQLLTLVNSRFTIGRV